MKMLLVILALIPAMLIAQQTYVPEDSLEQGIVESNLEKYSIDSSCLRMASINCECFGFINSDSVMINICDTTNKYFYSKRTWAIIFKSITIELPVLPRDTLIMFSNIELDSILSLKDNFIDLRNFFQNISRNYGNFYLKKEYPDIIDSSSWASRGYLLSFDDYVIVDEIERVFFESELFTASYYQNSLYSYPEHLELFSSINSSTEFPSFFIKIYSINSYAMSDWKFHIFKRVKNGIENLTDLDYTYVVSKSDYYGPYKLYSFFDSSNIYKDSDITYRICSYSLSQNCYGPCDSVRINIPTSIENNISSNKICITPNPATDYIEIAAVEGVNGLMIYDVLGNVVLSLGDELRWSNGTRLRGDDILVSSEGNVRIDVSMLPKGVYFVKVGGQMYKFVKL